MSLEKTYLRSIKEYMRGIIGGLLFSLPLLYTMEVWWAGFQLRPTFLVVGVLVTMLLLVGYNYYSGIREDEAPVEVLIDSVEELGLGLVTSAIVLLILGRLNLSMSVDEILGRVIVEGMAVAIGVSVGTAQLGGETEGQKDRGVRGAGTHQTFGSRVVLGFCGAVLFSLNVAPTEEIVMIALEAEPWHLIGMEVMALGIGSVILFFADFRGTRALSPESNRLVEILMGTTVMYAIALVSAGFVLWFFGRFDGIAATTALAEMVVLGFVGMMGATAGRLLLGA